MGWKPLTITKCFHALCIFTSMTAHNTYPIVSVSCSIQIPPIVPYLLVNIPILSPKMLLQLMIGIFTNKYGKNGDIPQYLHFSLVKSWFFFASTCFFRKRHGLEVQASPTDHTLHTLHARNLGVMNDDLRGMESLWCVFYGDNYGNMEKKQKVFFFHWTPSWYKTDI